MKETASCVIIGVEHGHRFNGYGKNGWPVVVAVHDELHTYAGLRCNHSYKSSPMNYPDLHQWYAVLQPPQAKYFYYMHFSG